jgi:hypothetical protein
MVMPFLGRLFGKGEPDDDWPTSRMGNKNPPAPNKGDTQFVFKWHDPGPGNPFGIRVLDCRSLTLSVIATTKDKAVAERYNFLRGSDGSDLIGAAIEDPIHVPVSLKFPHNGEKLEGIVFKAGSMDVKWDIYVYDSVFLFARSWTGELCYRAVATIGLSEIHITEIECPRSDAKIAASHVYFLMGTHAMRRVLPHRLPEDTPDDPMTIATLSFSLFGKFGCYATFEGITQIPILLPKAP